MSQYYWLICWKHRERVDACSHIASGAVVELGDSPTSLKRFIVRHCGCPVEIVGEHGDDAYDESFREYVYDAKNEMTVDLDGPIMQEVADVPMERIRQG